MDTFFKVKFRNPSSGKEQVKVCETFPTLEWLLARVDSLEDVTPIGYLPPRQGMWQVISIEPCIDVKGDMK